MPDPSRSGPPFLGGPGIQAPPGSALTSRHPDLEAEQAYFDLAHACLDTARERAAMATSVFRTGRGGTTQARFEREAMLEATLARLTKLNIGDRSLVFGRIDPEGTGNPVRLRGIVEKPAADEAPSDLGVVGRYVLGPSIFEQLERIEPGAGGELQLTDALAGQIAGGEPVYACRFEGRRYDAGRPAGAIAAAVAAAFDREEIRRDLLAHLTTLMPTEQ